MTDRLASPSFVALDFDGPVCSLFEFVDLAKARVELAGVLGLSPELVTDIFDVLHLSGPDAGARSRAHDYLATVERQGAATARLTPGIGEVLAALSQRGVRVAIVTNNAPDVVQAFAARCAPALLDVPVYGRGPRHVPRLKPAPDLVIAALEQSGVAAQAGVFVGDSVTDIEAGHAAGLVTVGYANRPGKSAWLRDAGADAIVHAIDDLLGVLF